MTAGGRPEDPSEFYASPKLDEAIRDLRGEFDLILLDMPDGGHPSRLLRIASLVEGVLIVVASERVQAAEAQGIRSLLCQSGAKLLGVLVNKQRDYVPRWLRPRG